MKKIIILILFVIGIIFVYGCDGIDLSKVESEDMERLAEAIISCESPYIRFESGCCLDSDNNGICDQEDINCKYTEVPYDVIEEFEEEETYPAVESYTEESCTDIEIPYTATEKKTRVLFNAKDTTLSFGDRWSFPIDLEADISVDVSFDADDTMSLWVMDDDDFDKVLSGGQIDQQFIKKIGVSSADASFKTIGADTYIFYLKNNHRFEKVSVFNFKAIARWDEEVQKTKTEETCQIVTKYRDVEKTRTVTKMKTVTKTKTEQVCT